MYLDFYLFIFIFFSTPQIENILSDLWINCISHECILFFIDGIFIFLSSSLKGTLKSLRRESLEQKCRKWRLEFLSLIFMNHWSTYVTSHCINIVSGSDSQRTGSGGPRVHRHHLRQLQKRWLILLIHIFDVSYHLNVS